MNIHLGSVLPHSDIAICVTMTIFQTSSYRTPSAIDIFCGFSWKANIIYRQLQATTTTEPSTASPSWSFQGTGSIDRILPTNQNSSVLSNPIHYDVTNRSIDHNYYNFNNHRFASQSITNAYRGRKKKALVKLGLRALLLVLLQVSPLLQPSYSGGSIAEGKTNPPCHKSSRLSAWARHHSMQDICRGLITKRTNCWLLKLCAYMR